MAIVRELVHVPATKKAIHPTSVPVRFDSFEVEGETILQLTSGGERGLETKKNTQSFQIDRELAGHLLEVLLEAFPELEARSS